MNDYNITIFKILLKFFKILYFSRYFSEINRSTLDQLLKIYKLDFELFDYDYRKYYKYVNMDVETQYPTTLKTQENFTKTKT